MAILSVDERNALFEAAIESHAAYTWEFQPDWSQELGPLEEWGIEAVQADDESFLKQPTHLWNLILRLFSPNLPKNMASLTWLKNLQRSPNLLNTTKGCC